MKEYLGSEVLCNSWNKLLLQDIEVIRSTKENHAVYCLQYYHHFR